MNISTNTNHIHGTGIGFRRNGTARALLAMAITATTVGLAATSYADDRVASQLQSLMPTPANTQLTDGPASIPDDGIHMHFLVNGSATDVLAAYKTALEHKGWAVTVVSSEAGEAPAAQPTPRPGARPTVWRGEICGRIRLWQGLEACPVRALRSAAHPVSSALHQAPRYPARSTSTSERLAFRRCKRRRSAVRRSRRSTACRSTHCPAGSARG